MLLLSISQPSARLHSAPLTPLLPKRVEDEMAITGAPGNPIFFLSISLERVGGPFLVLLPSRRKALVTLAQLVHRVRLVSAISTAALTMPVSPRAFRNRYKR
jgi:hypothetical protein